MYLASTGLGLSVLVYAFFGVIMVLTGWFLRLFGRK